MAVSASVEAAMLNNNVEQPAIPIRLACGMHSRLSSLERTDRIGDIEQHNFECSMYEEQDLELHLSCHQQPMQLS